MGWTTGTMAAGTVVERIPKIRESMAPSRLEFIFSVVNSLTLGGVNCPYCVPMHEENNRRLQGNPTLLESLLLFEVRADLVETRYGKYIRGNSVGKNIPWKEYHSLGGYYKQANKEGMPVLIVPYELKNESVRQEESSEFRRLHD